MRNISKYRDTAILYKIINEISVYVYDVEKTVTASEKSLW